MNMYKDICFFLVTFFFFFIYFCIITLTAGILNLFLIFKETATYVVYLIIYIFWYLTIVLFFYF